MNLGPRGKGQPQHYTELIRIFEALDKNENSEQMGDDYHSEDAFKFRRGQYFWHTRAVIGHGAAGAVAQRAKVAGHTFAPPPCRPQRARCTALPGHRTVSRLGFSGFPLD